MKENLDTDQLSALLTVYGQVRQKRGPMPWDISEHWIELIRDACLSSPEDMPELPLAGWSRDYLAAFVVESMRLWNRERDLLLKTIEGLSGDQDKDPERSAEESEPSEDGIRTASGSDDVDGTSSG